VKELPSAPARKTCHPERSEGPLSTRTNSKLKKAFSRQVVIRKSRSARGTVLGAQKNHVETAALGCLGRAQLDS